ncbi:MAG: DNRLRE domain-containing protein [Pirellulales bacterium]
MTVPSQELWTQLTQYADGQLSEAEVSQLEGQLASDQQSRRIYLLFMEMHSELAWTNRAVASHADKHREMIESEVVTHGRRFSPVGLWWNFVDVISHPTPLALIVAGLYVTVFVLSLALIKVPGAREEQQAELARNAQDFVAQIVRTHEPQWESVPSVGGDPATDLMLGEQLVLRSGLAEIRFDSGALVLLRGPATIVPRGNNRCELVSGDLTARTPPRASGFTVDTPNASFVDLGTEFGVGVDKQGPADMHVFEGVVEVRPRATGNGGKSAARQVHAGESVRVGSNGVIGSPSSSTASSRFLRITPSQPLDPRKTETVVFQQGRPDPFTGAAYEGCDDVALLEWAADVNFGGRTDFDVGNSQQNRRGRTLIRFDLSSLKGKAQAIRAVTLRLTTADREYSPAGPGEVRLFRLSDANADWREGSKTSGSDSIPQRPGDATWNHRGWAGSPGVGTVAVDYSPIIHASQSYRADQTKNATFDLRIDRDLGFVEAWANGETNAGFLLKNHIEDATSRICFYSSEHEIVEMRPQLIVEYVPITN